MTAPAEPQGDYFRQERDDLFLCLDRAAAPGRALEIGCGEGRFGARLCAMGFEVHGVESDPGAAAVAGSVLHRVLCEDIEAAALPYPEEHFDLLVCADVLEHLRDPWTVLRRLRVLLKRGGTAIASVPNAQYFPVVAGLLAGRFRYRDSGVLDRTHLRFFTRESARELFEQAGFAIEAMPVSYPGRPVSRAILGTLDLASFGMLRGFLTGQTLIRARRIS
ncbi:MAG: hypothetical protein Fur0037_25350 [Planctomycetota bacterium]